MKLRKSDLQIETIVSRIVKGELDLQPNFQRGEVWDLKRRQRLVDTVLRDWYIPAVHIVIETDGREVVLDGQQRLAAIRDFVTGGIRVNGKIEPHNRAIQALDGKRFSKLPDNVQRAVNRFELQVITLTDYEPQEPNELFFRLNQSYNLTPPEKRNALHGAARDQVKELVRDFVAMGLLTRERIGFSNGRLAYDDIIARTCVAVSLGTLRQHINNNVVEGFYRSGEFSLGTIDGVRRAGERLLTQIDGAQGQVKFNKGTLQTWLIYCYWAPSLTGDIPSELLSQFEVQRAFAKRGDVNPGEQDHQSQRVLEIVSVYDDRASYRVTDVSSVLARDLAVHLFSVARFGSPSRHGSDAILGQSALSASESAQSAILGYMETVGWDPLSEIPRAQ